MLHLSPDDDFCEEEETLPWYVVSVVALLLVLLDRRVLVILAGLLLTGGMLLLAGCTPALIRVEAPRFSPAAAQVDSRQSGAAGKATVESRGHRPPEPEPAAPPISDAQLQAWLDAVTGRTNPSR